ncbi:MAG: SidA/IucD/PvdA family monooxygenase [Nostoc sp.]|uniref:SidA/IucD/PvdA family monooxygenase n=1 Tax=Nostoc sp. TaxID=1180 RepID=UPI002FFAFE62
MQDWLMLLCARHRDCLLFKLQENTPKNLPGPELGIPALSFQAWYEARHGVEAYTGLDRIPRVAWAEYLSWYRHFLGIPVRYQTKLVRIEPDADFFRLHLEVNGVVQVETTRKIIFANGVAGTGGPNIPPVLASLPRTLYAHTADEIDFKNLRGKTVAVLGAAASAFDAAGVALESGAKAVGNAPYLKDIHVFNPAGFVSFGLPIGDVPSIRRDVPAVVARISHDLFFTDWSLHEARIASGNISPDFDTSLYADAVWKQQAKVKVAAS